MFHLLGFLFIILIVVLVVGLTIVGSVLRAIFGFGRKRRPATTENTHRAYTHRTTDNATGNSQSSQQDTNEEVVSGKAGQGHKKIFTKDEGEYVDFEEV